jgi:hypothetical protein
MSDGQLLTCMSSAVYPIFIPKMPSGTIKGENTLFSVEYLKCPWILFHSTLICAAHFTIFGFKPHFTLNTENPRTTFNPHAIFEHQNQPITTTNLLQVTLFVGDFRNCKYFLFNLFVFIVSDQWPVALLLLISFCCYLLVVPDRFATWDLVLFV